MHLDCGTVQTDGFDLDADAMFKASMASLVSRVRLIAQPTKALEYASRTAAR